MADLEVVRMKFSCFQTVSSFKQRVITGGWRLGVFAIHLLVFNLRRECIRRMLRVPSGVLESGCPTKRHATTTLRQNSDASCQYLDDCGFVADRVSQVVLMPMLATTIPWQTVTTKAVTTAAVQVQGVADGNYWNWQPECDCPTCRHQSRRLRPTQRPSRPLNRLRRLRAEEPAGSAEIRLSTKATTTRLCRLGSSAGLRRICAMRTTRTAMRFHRTSAITSGRTRHPERSLFMAKTRVHKLPPDIMPAIPPNH